jgi:hypothetical protein
MRRAPTVDVVAFRYSKIFNAALREVKAIKKRYLSQYLRYKFGGLPPRYLKDLRAYAVLVSATLEQCAEDLVWAHLYQMANVVTTQASGASLAIKAADQMRIFGENALNKSHGLQGEEFRAVSLTGGFPRTLTPVEGNAFTQLGMIRNESAHTYIVTIRDPKDVWAYTCEVMTCVRNLGIECAANRTTGFRSTPP